MEAGGNMRCISPILVALACALPAFAQTARFSIGAIGGVRLSSGAPDETHDESPRYTVGGDFEVAFGDHFAAEADALYKRFGYSTVSEVGFESDPGGPETIVDYVLTRVRANSVEFPILGKYYFGRRSPWGRFFVATGYSFQRSWMTSTSGIEPVGANSGAVEVFGGINVPGPPVQVGAVFGCGLARKVGRVTMAPTFRYTRWGWRPDGADRNQAEVLLCLRY